MSATMMDERPLLTIAQAAERLNMSASGVYRLLDAGVIPYARLRGTGARCAARRIPAAALEKYIAQGMTTADE